MFSKLIFVQVAMDMNFLCFPFFFPERIEEICTKQYETVAMLSLKGFLNVCNLSANVNPSIRQAGMGLLMLYLSDFIYPTLCTSSLNESACFCALLP